MSNQTIQFKSKNYLPLLNSDSWVKSDGAYLDNTGALVIPYGGSISFNVEAFKQTQFNYYKVEVNAACEAFDAESSVDTDALITASILYSSYTGEVVTGETCGMNIATITKVAGSPDEYFDSKVNDTLPYPIYDFEIKVENRVADSILVVRKLILYVSEDYSSSQIINTVDEQLKRNKYTRGIVGTSQDGSEIRYIKVARDSDTLYKKIKPHYDGNTLLRITKDDITILELTYEIDDEIPADE